MKIANCFVLVLVVLLAGCDRPKKDYSQRFYEADNNNRMRSICAAVSLYVMEKKSLPATINQLTMETYGYYNERTETDERRPFLMERCAVDTNGNPFEIKFTDDDNDVTTELDEDGVTLTVRGYGRDGQPRTDDDVLMHEFITP